MTNKYPGETRIFIFKEKEGHWDMSMYPIKKTLCPFSHMINAQIISISHRLGEH